MEAIGRLAGGVAHDFNNLLTAIIGYADMIAERTDLGRRHGARGREIRMPPTARAALTRQLLAFSRKQFLNPTVINLNEGVAGLLQMLPARDRRSHPDRRRSWATASAASRRTRVRSSRCS